MRRSSQAAGPRSRRPLSRLRPCDFDRYVEEHGIPAEDHPAAFALWYAEVTGEPVPRFENVEREPAGLAVEGDDVISPAFSRQLHD